MRCPRCHHDNARGSRYCARCGVQLEALGAPWGGEAAGERRQLTVMFCDLVEFSALAERLDPEELREVLAAYREACARIIDRFEGQVAQWLGDGVLAYFSYPEAHEDDANRAVRAGLEIAATVGALEPRVARERAVPLRVRIGIHTGPVVVAGGGPARRGEPVALGHTVNVAARLQGVAEPGSVVISAETLQLVRGLFVTEDLGPCRLRGLADAIAVHRVLRPSGVRTRLDVAPGLTPLIGREQDLALLLDQWDRAREGHGVVVLVGGEPGIGKSRLVRALRERLADERHTWLECHGSPHHPNSALHPVIELLHEGLRFAAPAPGEATAWLERTADFSGLAREEAVPLLARLLSLPPPEGYAPLALSPEAQRRKTLEALAAWLFALAALQPVALVVEDLHWFDPSSLELLGMLMERVPEAPLLVLATFRPGFEPPWELHPPATVLVVQPLTRRQTAAMATSIAGAASLSPQMLEHVVRHTDGVPLFVEELTKSVLESGLGADIRIPATLRDSLMARLDRLGAAKAVAQLASVLGREFSHELLAAVWTGDAPTLERALRRLRDAGLVYPRGEPPDTSHVFKHALIQEVAYRSLLRETRRALHRRVAQVLAERLPERVASEPEQIARHCEGGGLIDQAVSYYQQAGELATRRSAHAEAIAHRTRAIELLRMRPPSVERDERELMLQIELGASLGAARGWGTREAQSAYDRARALCEQLGETRQLFPAIRGLTAFYTSHAELATAADFSSRLLRLAEQGGEPSHLLLAHHHVGLTHFLRGEPTAACTHFERGLAFYDPSQHRGLAALYQADPGVFVRIWMAWALWVLGLPEQALARADEGLAMARAAGHPFTLGYTLLWTANVHLWRREREPAGTLAAEAIEIGQEQELAFVLAGGRLMRAVVQLVPQAAAAEIEAAHAEFQRALADFGRTGSTGAGRPHMLGELAAALAGVGREAPARAFIDSALAFSEQTAQSYWDAELLRLRGELLLRDRATREAGERALRRALEVARKQRARMLELRAAVTLGRLLGERGERDAARRTLAGVYGSFTEGLDTADLSEARALLDQLA